MFTLVLWENQEDELSLGFYFSHRVFSHSENEAEILGALSSGMFAGRKEKWL